MKIDEDFRRKLVVDYQIDFNWKKIFLILNQQNKNAENNVKLFFYRKFTNLIFRFDDFTIDDHVYEPRRLCIFQSIVQNILVAAHVENDSHFEFVRCYEFIFVFYYICELFKYFRNYLKHCFKCLIYQIRRHKSYESLQSIFTSSIFFHTIIIDFILTLSSTLIYLWNCVIICNCKYFKRIILIFDLIIWFATKWKHVLLNRLNMTDWNLSKAIIFDRDKKFLSKMWTIMFFRLKVTLLYAVVYHSQIDDLFKRTNQTVKIAFRFLIFTLKHFNRWSKILSRIQRDFNNFVNIDFSLNEIVYEFTSIQIMNLIKSIVVINDFSLTNNRFIIKSKVVDVIIFDQMNAKFHYDRKHKLMFMKQDDYALLKLHKSYNISSTNFNRKYNQQFVDFFLITKKIKRLIYRLTISNH